MARGLSRPEACGIFWTREGTLVPCTGRQILNHWTTREVRVSSFWKWWYFSVIYSKETFFPPSNNLLFGNSWWPLDFRKGSALLEKNSRPETLPGTHGPISLPSPSGLPCMSFCRGWWMSCRKLPSELESFWSQTLKFFFRKTLWASVICPWQNKALYFPILCKCWMLSAQNGLYIEKKVKQFFEGELSSTKWWDRSSI